MSREERPYTSYDDPYEPDEPGYRGMSPGLKFFLTASLGLFVLGGLFFGFVFLDNLRTLLEREGEVTVDVPVAGHVRLPNVGGLPQIDLPALPKNLPQIGPGLLLPEWQGNRPVAILLLGSDRRADESIEETRSDTMMLVLLNPETRGASIVSIPRDLWVTIPGYGEQRINVAHAVGGPELAKRTVAHNFGVEVDYYARIDFVGFIEIVDTLGGVMIDVERPIKDDAYPTEDYGVKRIYIAPGPQLMDGRTALQYVRSRHSENDFGRMQRQQRFIVAMRDRAIQLDVLPKLPSLLSVAQRTISTDLGPTQMLALARLGSEVDRGRIESLVLDTRFARPHLSPEGADLLLPDLAAIQSAVQDLVSGTHDPTGAPATVEVLNGTSRAGLAQATADYLSGQGYSIVRVEDADRQDYLDSTILVLAGEDLRTGQTIASLLGVSAQSVTEAAAEGAQVRIILGESFALPR